STTVASAEGCGLNRPLVADVTSRDGAHPAAAVIVERLGKLFVRVHHKGAVPGDRLADGLTADHQHLEVRCPAFLDEVRREGHYVAGAERGQLSRANRGTSRPHGTASRQQIHEAIEVAPPGKAELGTGVGRDV